MEMYVLSIVAKNLKRGHCKTLFGQNGVQLFHSRHLQTDDGELPVMTMTVLNNLLSDNTRVASSYPKK